MRSDHLTIDGLFDIALSLHFDFGLYELSEEHEHTTVSYTLTLEPDTYFVCTICAQDWRHSKKETLLEAPKSCSFFRLSEHFNTQALVSLLEKKRLTEHVKIGDSQKYFDAL